MRVSHIAYLAGHVPLGEVLHIVDLQRPGCCGRRRLVRASGTGEVWAIDHGSSDGSWEWLRDHLPEANRIQGPNAGFGEGNNRGLEEALRRNVDAVHLLNQDAKVDPTGMATQVEWLLDRANRGHRLEVSSPIHWDWTGAEPYWHFDHLYAQGWREQEAPFEVRFINAAAWLMTLDTVRTVGGFNPAFFMYGRTTNGHTASAARAGPSGSTLTPPSTTTRK